MFLSACFFSQISSLILKSHISTGRRLLCMGIFEWAKIRNCIVTHITPQVQYNTNMPSEMEIAFSISKKKNRSFIENCKRDPINLARKSKYCQNGGHFEYDSCEFAMWAYVLYFRTLEYKSQIDGQIALTKKHVRFISKERAARGLTRDYALVLV